MIEFEPGRIRVYSAGREPIPALVAQWKKHRDWKVITVEGHGSLALRRAERIRDYLVRYGVPKEFVVAEATDERGARPYWGATLAEIDAEHFAQVGWRFTARSTFDASATYVWINVRFPAAVLRSLSRLSLLVLMLVEATPPSRFAGLSRP